MIFLLLFYVITFTVEARDLLLTIPPVKPIKEDQYICHGLNLQNETLFITAKNDLKSTKFTYCQPTSSNSLNSRLAIRQAQIQTGFTPRANASHSHHILIYTCLEPGSTKPTWNCEEMSGNEGGPCKSGLKIIYAWAMNAPGFQLPKDVSVMVGKEAGSQYIVMQNHYKNVDYFKSPNALPDQSGFVLQVQNQPTKKLAGLYVLSTGGSIPGHSTVFMEAACSYTGKVRIHPFAFRVHTHKLGKLVSGYIIHNKKWKEIGKKSPQIEQLFYPMERELIIQPGDTLAARCIMENKNDNLVKIGPTRKDEMCNFYIYYWVYKEENDQIYDKDNQFCYTPGWPNFKWNDFMGSLKIPDAAAIMPGENKIIKEMISDMKNTEKEMDSLFSKFWDDNYNDYYGDDLSNENALLQDSNIGNFQDEDEFF